MKIQFHRLSQQEVTRMEQMTKTQLVPSLSKDSSSQKYQNPILIFHHLLAHLDSRSPNAENHSGTLVLQRN